MDGSRNRLHTTVRRAALPVCILATGIIVAGCGGGGGGKSASAPAPVSKTSASGGVVTAQGTAGLVGPSARSTANKQQFDDKAGRIPAKAKGKTNGQKHAVAGESACPGGDLMPTPDNIDQLNAAIFCLVNLERAAAGGLPDLKQNGALAQAAGGMCNQMITEHFFSHETPEGKNVVDRIQPTGYIPRSGDWVVGENLAWGSGALSTPQAIVNGWMNSPGHKANILAPDYKDIGLAACNGSPLTTVDGGTVYVNNFGAQSGANVNVTLPGHEDTNASNSNASAATVAGAKSAAKRRARVRAKRRNACVRRARKVKSSSRRRAAVSRCRARYSK
jgi:uncharacterized protein YkwD